MVTLCVAPLILIPDAPNVKVLLELKVIQPPGLAIIIPAHVMSPPSDTVPFAALTVLSHLPMSVEVGTMPVLQLPVWLRGV